MQKEWRDEKNAMKWMEGKWKGTKRSKKNEKNRRGSAREQKKVKRTKRMEGEVKGNEKKWKE